MEARVLHPTWRRSDSISHNLPVYSLSAPFRHALCCNVTASSAPDAQDSAPYEDRRAYPRVPVAMPAFLQANGERYAVHLLDVSAGGAKLDCSATIPTGTTVVLDCGSLRRSAVIRWQTGGALGLCFDSELDAREVTALIARSMALDARLKKRNNA